MNINQVVSIGWNQNRDDIVSASQWECCLRISSAHYQRIRQFLKAEELQRNCHFDSKEYGLYVACQFCMLCNVWKNSKVTTSRAHSH